MKKIIAIVALLLSVQLASWAQIGGDYNPSSPADPGTPVLKYTLTLSAIPEDGGSFNYSSQRVDVGSSNSLYAYNSTDFVFKYWMIGDSVLSSEQEYKFIMPSNNVHIVGVFEYDPVSPSNPNINFWDKQNSLIIADDFTPGYLSNAVSKVLGEDNKDEVQMIIVAGKINSNDFSIANDYKKCTMLDLSRTTGVKSVPSYAFDYTNLASVYLPSTIEEIGNCAFLNCEKLSSITIYSLVPPTLGTNVFKGVPEGFVIYVPAAALSQYLENESWNIFTLLPIQEDIRSITISLPEGTEVRNYARMWLELTNIKNGQRIHYVMTDRDSYTFSSIIRNTSWNVVLRNERGDVFGQIDNVEVKDDDVSVNFTTLSKPQNVSVSVLTPDGTDVTGNTQITWTDAENNYLAQATSLSGLPVGYQVNCRIVLSQELAMLYETPKIVEYTLNEGGNNYVYQLVPISKVQVSGKVNDMATGLPLSGAIISASQTFNGKYSKTLNAKTNEDGVFAIEIANVPTIIAYAANDHISQTFDFSTILNDSASVELPDVYLKSITGAIVKIGLTYTTCGGGGIEPETQDGYSDYNNISYSIFNKTKKTNISQFHVQYPKIVLLEQVDDGDTLILTATSRVNAFVPVTSSDTVNEQKAYVSFGITELGKIHASFRKSGNASVVGTLYNASGKLIKTESYSEASLSISNLADGEYSLLSMGSSRLFNTIYDLAQLPQTGLIEGIDYVLNKVEVKSGIISYINIDEVPTFDESKLYYTGDNTSFTVNKSSLVAGNYLTLSGRIDFKPKYVTDVSNVQMVIDLPDSYSFVENSVMIGNSTGNYTLNGTRLSIPIANYTDRIRFCVVPTCGGVFAPSAFAQFEYQGDTVMQPIGSAPTDVKDIEIIVPSSTPNKSFRVSGKAESNSSVSIYLDSILSANVMANAVGDWSTECQFIEPRNFSEHTVYAIFEKASRPTLVSETKTIIYNPLEIVVKSVEMTFWNAWYKKQFTVIWDFINGTVDCNKYYFYKATDMTFLIDLEYQDKKLIPFVWLHVYTSDGKVRSLRADYDESKDRWIATDRFTPTTLPTRVSVTVENMIFDPSEEASYELLRKDFGGKRPSIEVITYDSLPPTPPDGTPVPDDSIGGPNNNNPGDNTIWVKPGDTGSPSGPSGPSGPGGPGDTIIVITQNENLYYLFTICLTNEEVSSTITRQWKKYFNTYLDSATCSQVTEYREYTEHFEEYVKIITSTLIAQTILVDNPELPEQLRIPVEKVIAKLKRVLYSSKRYLAQAVETLVVPMNCTPPPPPVPPAPPVPTITPILDPSGYVYEGVASNRVEGATATVFYKEEVEDIYGDLHENIVKWDAEEFAQENPLFTDEFGMYAWDVPQGLWQVKFEKDGYETSYSEWLPVPPPQLEVNVSMKQNIQPNVKNARAFEEAVEFEFNKYMIPELLNSENITVMADGNAVEGTIELLNEEESYEGSAETFASKVRFNAAQPFESTEIVLTVSNRVQSYAGIRMENDFSQTFAVEREIRKIECDSVNKIIYGQPATITVSVLPAIASAGKTLNVSTSSPMILGTRTTSTIIDENGVAQITVYGELPGTAALYFSVDGYDISETAIVNVQQLSAIKVATPTASIASGSTVDKETEIYLFCETEGATIYYTLDGTCPCDDSESVIKYDGTAIVINDSTVIKAMATVPDMYDSDVAQFIYTINDGDGVESVYMDNTTIQIYPLPVRDVINVYAGGKTINKIEILNLNGIRIISYDVDSEQASINVSHLAAGVFIIRIQAETEIYSNKILKLK